MKKKNTDFSKLKPLKESLIISFIYGLIGSLWIGFTDKLVLSLNQYDYTLIQTLKGIIWIILTMVLLFLLVYRRLTDYKDTLITLDYSFNTLTSVEKELKINIQKLEEKQKELSISNQRFELAVDGVNDAIWDWDIVNDIYYLSPKWKVKIMNQSNGDTFDHWINFIHPEDKERYVDFIQNFIAKKRELYHYIFRIVCFDQTVLWIYSNGKAIYDQDGKAIRIAGSHTDISNQIKLKEEYKKNNFLVEKIINNTSNFVIIWDHLGKIKQINPYVTKTLGYDTDDYINHSWFDLFTPNLSTEERENIIYQIKNERIHQFNSHVKSINKQDVYILWTSNILYQDQSNEFDVISIGTDITSLKIIKDELNYLSYYDDLTDLPNRNFFEKHVNEIIEKRNPFAILYLDVDNFKHVNDTLGHAAGDQLLKRISEILVTHFKTPHFVSRLSGDEFLIVLNNYNKIDQIIKYLNYISKENSKPWIYNDQEYFITVTVGISIYPEHGKDLETLLKNADIAMHNAKESGKNNYHVFDTKMLDENAIYIKTINELKKALNNDELVLYYQPLIDIKSNDVVGAEALVRWQHPTRGLVYPADFITIAEKTGFIDEIDRIVFEMACKQKKYWDELGYTDFKLSINISNKRLKNKYLYEEMKEIINKYGINPSTIQLEITETVIMENLDQGIEVLDKIRDAGINIALDDFGKGFSSLNYLMTLPIDHVKLDKIFIDNIHKEDHRVIIHSIIQLVHALKKQVTIEGIETIEQLELIKQYKCDIGQGFYFDKPIDAESLERHLKNKTISVKSIT